MPENSPQSEERLRLIVDASPSGMLMVDKHGTIVLVNCQIEKLFGYTRDELLGKTLEILVPQAARARHPAYREEFFRNPQVRAMGAGRDLFGLHKNESQIPVEIGLNPLRIEEQDYVLVSVLDITERIRTQRIIKESEDRFRLLVSGVKDYAIILLDTNGYVMSWNDGAQRIKGYTDSEIIGKHFSVFHTEEDKLEGIPLQKLETAVRMGSCEFEGLRVRKDGSIYLANVIISVLTDENGTIRGYAKVTRDITERRKAEESLLQAKEELEHRVQERTRELSQAKDQAQAASKLKSEFVANMSHEIRTPMNAIVGMCNVLLKTDLDEQQRRFANNIRDGANTLLTVINDILDFSKIEANRLELELVDFDMVGIVERTCELLATSARSKKLSLMAFVDPKMPQQLRGDPERIRQILINLSSNAIKFSKHGEIIVSATVESLDSGIAEIKFSVSDQGIGISEEQQGRLFRPFVQADGSINRRFGGTGLGLSICKKLVELMHGEIGLNSHPGEGSTFWFKLPLEVRNGNPSAKSSEEIRNVRVLIVADESQSRQIIHSYIESWGMRNGGSVSSGEALRTLRQAYVDGDPFGVAVIDQVLGESSIELAADIRKDTAISSLKMILLTAFDTPGLGRQAISSGFSAYLTKPFRRSHLLEAIITACTGAESPQSYLPLRRSASDKRQRTGLILIAEDYQINQQVAQLYLDELGFASHIASNGVEVMQALLKDNYSLILMDCQMPEMDGFAATRATRTNELSTGEHIPIIAMTAHALAGDKERCLAAGMDDYISKPIDQEQLKNVIEKWLPHSAIGEGKTSQAEAPNIVPIDLDAIYERYASIADELIVRLVSELAEEMSKLEHEYRVGNQKEFGARLHGLKGICGTIFAKKMHKTGLLMENAVHQNNWELLKDLLAKLRQEYREVKDILKDKLGHTD